MDTKTQAIKMLTPTNDDMLEVDPTKFVEPNEKASDQIGNTRRYARMLHGDQTDKQGYEYVTHLDAVAYGVWQMTKDAELVKAAYLHDVLEDTACLESDLVDEGFSERVIAAVKAVTKPTGAINHQYTGNIIKAGPDAMWIKLSDLYHNTRADRIEGLKEHDQNRLLKKYYPAIWRIEQALIKAGLLTEGTMTFEKARAAAEKPLYTAPKSTKTPAVKSSAVTNLPAGSWKAENYDTVGLDEIFGAGDLIRLFANGTPKFLRSAGDLQVTGSGNKVRTFKFEDGTTSNLSGVTKVYRFNYERAKKNAANEAAKPVKVDEKNSVALNNGWRRPGKEQTYVPVSVGCSFKWDDSDVVLKVKSAVAQPDPKTGKQTAKQITFDNGVSVLITPASKYTYKLAPLGSATTPAATWKDYMGLPGDWKDGDPIPV